jgi:hypothetical protein
LEDYDEDEDESANKHEAEIVKLNALKFNAKSIRSFAGLEEGEYLGLTDCDGVDINEDDQEEGKPCPALAQLDSKTLVQKAFDKFEVKRKRKEKPSGNDADVDTDQLLLYPSGSYSPPAASVTPAREAISRE